MAPGHLRAKPMKLLDVFLLLGTVCASCSTNDHRAAGRIEGNSITETTAQKAETRPAHPTHVSGTHFAAILGKVGPPISFDAAFAEIRQIPRLKGEFETTSEFNKRQAAALSKCKPVYLIQAPVDHQYVRYDADKQALVVATYALTNTLATRDELDSLFGFGSELKKAGQRVRYSGLRNVVWPLPRVTKNVGTYKGANTFGVSVTITKQEQVARGVFEREARGQETVWFATPRPYIEGSPPVAFEIKADPPTAKALKKDGLRAAILVAPRAPFHAMGTTRFTPTIRAPYDRTGEVRYLIANIQCAAIYDSHGKLLATRATR